MDETTKPPSLTELFRAILGGCIDHEQERAGRCVYCKPCGRRLYQGSPMTADERAELKAAIAELEQTERK